MRKFFVLGLLIFVSATNFCAYSQNTGSSQSLTNHFSNNKYSIDYPASWEVVAKDYKISGETISVQIMETDNGSHYPANLNVIIMAYKRTEPASTLAKTSLSMIRNYNGFSKFIGQTDNIQLSDLKGSMIEYEISSMGYNLCQQQYILKKSDNTVYTITICWDKGAPDRKKVLINILNSFSLK